MKDDTISRCEMMAVTKALMKRYCPVSAEQIHLLFDAKAITFTLFLRIDDVLVEYIKPNEFSKELLQNILGAIGKKDDDVTIFIRKVEQQLLLDLQSEIRNNKIQNLFHNDPSLDLRILKVFDQISSASQMIVDGGITKDVAERVKLKTAGVIDQLLKNPEAISTLSKMIQHDHTLYDHSATVAMLAVSISSQLNSHKFSRSDFTLISLCGLYHDIGKTCIPSFILNKPGTFTPQEYEVMKTHAALGQEHLDCLCDKGIDIPPIVSRVAGEHHERFDGSGYPWGKSGRFEENEATGIHLYTRIVSIADVYSALLMERVYKPAFDPMASLEIMIKLSKNYDPIIFKSFVEKVLKSLKGKKASKNNGGRIFTKEKGQAPQLFSKIKKTS